MLFNAKLKTPPPALRKEDEALLDQIRRQNNLFREIYFIHLTIKNARLTDEQKKVKKLHSKTLSQEIYDNITKLSNISTLPKAISSNVNVLTKFIDKIKNNTNN